MASPAPRSAPSAALAVASPLAATDTYRDDTGSGHTSAPRDAYPDAQLCGPQHQSAVEPESPAELSSAELH